MIIKYYNKLKIIFNYAFKSIYHNLLQSFFLILAFLSLIFIITFGFSIRWLVNSYFEDIIYQEYKEIDFYMGVDRNSQTRYFSLRHLQESENIDEYIESYLPFFEIDLLLKANNQNEYVKSISSSLSYFKTLIGEEKVKTISLLDDQVIITSSLSKKLNLGLNDSLLISIGEENKEFVVVEIIDDTILFKNEMIFTNKSSLISFVLQVINPGLGDLNPLFTQNIYNKVYFFALEGISQNEAISEIKKIEQYNNLDYEIVYDINKINQKVNELANIFYAAIIIIAVFVGLVIFINATMFFERKKQNIAILSLIGKSNFEIYLLTLFEFFLLIFIAFILNLFLLSFIIESVQISLGMLLIEKIPFTYFIRSYLSIMIICLFSFLVFKRRFALNSPTQNSKVEINFKFIKARSFLISISLGIILLVLDYLFLGFKYWSLILLFMAFSVITFLMSIIFMAISLILDKFRNNRVDNYYLKILLKTKMFKQYTSIILITFFSILLLFLVQKNLNQTVILIRDEYRFDYSLNNLNNKIDDIYNALEENEKIKSVSKTLILNDVKLNDYNFTYLISSSINDLEENYNFDFDYQLLNRNDKKVAILPYKFLYLDKIKIGDIVTLVINEELEVEVEIVGYKNVAGNVIVTNLSNFNDEYNDFAFNTLLIKSNQEDKVIIKNELINDYAKDLVYIVDYDYFVERTLQLEKINTYFSSLSNILILCFVISIISFSKIIFIKNKENFDKLKLLGLNNISLIRINYVKSIYSFIIFFVLSSLLFFVVALLIPHIIIIFNEYQNFKFNFTIIINSLFLLLLLSFLIETYFSFNILKK